MTPGPRWEAQVVDRLLELRADGFEFREAWRMALRLHPPRGHDLGSPRNLFDEQNRATETSVEFFRRVAGNAYNQVEGPPKSGNGPRIRDFRPEMVMELDASGPARPARGRIRQAAA